MTKLALDDGNGDPFHHEFIGECVAKPSTKTDEQRVAVNPSAPFGLLQDLESEQSVTNGRLKFATRHPRGDSPHDDGANSIWLTIASAPRATTCSVSLGNQLLEPHNALVGNRQM